MKPVLRHVIKLSDRHRVYCPECCNGKK